MKTFREITVLLLTISLLLLNVATAAAVPPLPSSFYGTVKVNGANVAAGTRVTALINGVEYSGATVQLYQGDTVYSLNVKGDDSSTSGVVEGGIAGDTIIFQIGSLTAVQTGTWASGANVELNLTALLNAAPVITEGAAAPVTMSKNGVPTAFNLTLHATDADSDTLTWSITTQAGHGTAIVSGSGASKVITYQVAKDYVGTDSFVVRVDDGKGGTDTITVNVTIQDTGTKMYIPIVRRAP